MTEPRYVLMLTDQSGRCFGIRYDRAPVDGGPDHTRGPVVDDLDAGVEVGSAGATCQPILVDTAGEQQVLFAGTRDLSEQKFTAVDGSQVLVHRDKGVWMSFPQPFTPGMVVAVAGLDAEGKELFRLESPPLDSDRLGPMFGPGWTTYAPLG